MLMKRNRIPLIAIAALLLASSKFSGAEMLPTNRDGTLQAIAQSPTSIAVYWKPGAGSSELFVNGVPCPGLSSSLDATSGFACALVSDLAPDTSYLFSLSKDGPGIVEKTWSSLPKRADYDVLVIGGTASGTAAAVTAARLGLRVALVEETTTLGGMASNGLGSTDMRDMARSNGFFEDFRRRIIAFYNGTDGRFYEPRVANAIFKSLVYEHPNLTLFMKATAVKPIGACGRVLGAVVRDASGRCGEIRAAVTIDATYTGDFAAACGAPFCVGREARSDCEPHAGEIYFDNAKQETLPGSTGKGDCKQQSYAYLMIWKDYGDQQAPQIAQPRFYDPETYRYSPEWNKTWNYLYGRVPGGKFEINQHPFGIDWPGINYDYPTASAKRRQEIADMNRDRALGYLYFMQNERGHKNLGLADNEFLDSGNFPQQLYIREARRFFGEYWFRECDVTNARSFHRADAIAIGDYAMDSHATEDLKDPNRIDKGEGELWLKSFTPWYQTPAGVVVPKSVEGLLITTAVSGSHIGYGTLRMEPVRMSMGQAAGAMAYWSVLLGMPLRDVNPAWTQDKILSQGAYINWNSDVNRDTRHFKAINFLGARGIFPEEAFRPDDALTRSEAMAALDQLTMLEGGNGLAWDVKSTDQPITRGEFAAWLVMAKQRTSDDWQLIDPPCAMYLDVPKGSPCYQAVETLAAHRITAMLFANADPGYFRPDESISRADAAQAIFLAHRAKAMRYWRR
jgi:hypothetical protein